VRGELLYSNRLMFLEHFQVHSKAEKKGGRKEGKEGGREGGREIDRWNLLVIGFPCS
jgi:hypothetical protein